MGRGSWRLSGYRVEDLIGAGSSGEVWRGRVTSTGAAVALKRVWVSGAGRRETALSEAAMLQSLDHPHLVRLHDVRRVDDDAIALVLDLAAGGSLASLLARRGRLTIGETITAMAPIGAALAYAHTNGVVHGDVSAANVLFTDIGLPLLADLGVARLFGDLAAVRTTPAYVDPLVAAGGLPTSASDVFMVAAVAFHALTGSPPWPSTNPQDALDEALTGEEPDFAGRLRAAGAPDAVVAVIARAMSIEPPSRGTAADFALELRHAGEPVAVELAAGRPRTPPVVVADAELFPDSWPLPSMPARNLFGTGEVGAAGGGFASGGVGSGGVASGGVGSGGVGSGGVGSGGVGSGSDSVAGAAAGDRVRGGAARGGAGASGTAGRGLTGGARTGDSTPRSSAAVRLPPFARQPLTYGVRAPSPFAGSPPGRHSAGGARPRIALGLVAVIVLVAAGVLAAVLWWPGDARGRAQAAAASSPPASSGLTAGVGTRGSGTRGSGAKASTAGTSTPRASTARTSASVPSTSRASTAGTPGKPTPATVASPATILATLDAARSAAFAARRPMLLAAVYASRTLLARDRALLTAIVPPGCGLLGVRTRFESTAVQSRTATSLRLRTRMTVYPSTLVCGTQRSGRAAGVPATPMVVTLVRVAGGYRIGGEHRLAVAAGGIGP